MEIDHKSTHTLYMKRFLVSQQLQTYPRYETLRLCATHLADTESVGLEQ
jgi:hypothetical protein